MNRETITRVVYDHYHVKINDMLSRVRKKQIASGATINLEFTKQDSEDLFGGNEK